MNNRFDDDFKNNFDDDRNDNPHGEYPYNYPEKNNYFNNKNSVNGEYHYTYPERNEYADNYNTKKEIIDADVYDKDSDDTNKNMVTISKGMRTFLITSVIVLVLILSLLLGYFIYMSNNGDFKNFNLPGIVSPSEPQKEAESNSEKPSNFSMNLENQPEDPNQLSAGQVYEKAAPSVVGVVVYDSEADIFSDPIGKASGVIMSDDGYIVTNSHVVGDSTKYGVKIVLNSSEKKEDGSEKVEEVSGKVVGIDKKTDLAVIKIDKTGLPKASFANSDQVKVGDWALAIGNPGAGDVSFDSTLTRGTISALNRSLGGSQKLVKYIQTDAAINPGNSGGALLNMYGQVIGINSVKLTPTNYEGMGFAIPSNTVKTIVDSIIANGYVSGRVVLGISGKMVSAYQAQMYNVPMGVIIAKINSDSDLSGKGVKTGDIIIKVNDVNVTGFDVLSDELSKYKVGESVKLTIYRPSGDRSNYSTFDVNVKLLEDKGETDTAASSIKVK